MHAEHAAGFLVGNEHNVNGTTQLFGAAAFQRPNGGQILNATAFHVLRAACVNQPGGGIQIGSEWRMRPHVRENGHNVHVRVEQNAGQLRFRAQPGEDDDGLGWVGRMVDGDR